MRWGRGGGANLGPPPPPWEQLARTRCLKSGEGKRDDIAIEDKITENSNLKSYHYSQAGENKGWEGGETETKKPRQRKRLRCLQGGKGVPKKKERLTVLFERSYMNTQNTTDRHIGGGGGGGRKGQDREKRKKCLI